jgi:DHA2 family multidrug resistance protein
LAFLFIPINTIAYVGVKQSENNDVSGLTNLARNIGGSCGTAFMATMLIRGEAKHENNMVRNLQSGNAGFNEQVTKLAGAFRAGNGTGVKGGPFGGASQGAIHQAQGFLYNQLHAQAANLAYVDIIRDLSVFCACMIPLLFFIPRPPKHAQMGH